MKYVLSLILLFVCISTTTFSQTTFTASTDAKQVLEGGYFDVSFTLNNAEGASFRPPSFKPFTVASGPNQSSQMQIINGKVSRKLSYSYSVVANKVGKYKIGAATIIVSGKTLKTKPINIEVLKGKPKAKTATGEDVEEIYVQLELSDSTVYIGQQITAKYMLYTTKDVSSADFRNEPAYEGFYAKRVRNLSDKAQRVIIDGTQYTKKALRTIAMFPQQTGKFTLDPVQVTLGLPVNSNRRNSFFFSTRTKPFVTNTEAVTISVLGTPPNAPNSFSGAIGKYTMTASIDKSTVTTDDAVTMTMHVRGIGDGKSVQAPRQENQAFDFYDPNVLQDESTERGDEIRVDKVYEYLMVPNRKGTFMVRPEFTYFDTDSNDYQTLYANNYRIKVLQGTGSKATLNIDKDNLGELRPMSQSTKLYSERSSFFGSPFHLTLVGLPFLSMLGLVFYKRKLLNEAAIDPSLKRQSAARQLAMKRLEAASNAKSAGDQKLFYEEINQGIYGYISDKFMVSPSDLNQSHIQSVLENNGVNDEMVSSFSDLIKTCQRALYASTTADDMSPVYEQAVNLISGIEDK